ncbi:serine/threonine protein kinase, partial [Sphaerisporangium sp. NPDC088356]
ARGRGDEPPGGRGRAEEVPGEEPPVEQVRTRAREAAEAAAEATPTPRKKAPVARPPRPATGPEERARARRAKPEGADRRTGGGGRARRTASDVKESLLGAQAQGGATSSPPGSAVLIMLAMVAVPCVVASVIWPLATFAITATFCVLARAWWSGHWLVRNRRSTRVRGTLRVVSFPIALAGSALSAAVWPGVPASAIAASAFWVAAGGDMGDAWWSRPGPMTVAGVVFGIVCGGIVGREVERIGVHVPDLRREGLRALSVLGGFVALCAAAVRILAWVLPHTL